MMKISGYAFFACAALSVAAWLGGCSSSSTPASVTSAEGESCSRTADCASGLACIDDTCVPKGTAVEDGGMMIGVDGGVVTPTPDGGVVVIIIDGGTVVVQAEAAPPPRPSQIGELCRTGSDCAMGLVCSSTYAYGGTGVCDVASYGLTPTGKTCTGECNTAADCCELPLNTSVGGTAVKTCQDIFNLILTGNTTQCTTAPIPSAASSVGVGCFLYATYCSSCATSNTWSCTKSQCVYAATCQNSGVELSGCPSVTRTGRALSTNCNAAKGNTCTPAATVGICTMDSECDTKPTTDTAVTCRGGDCTCYQQGCYIKCASDLDCTQGYSCNATTKLCTKNAGCSTNADCAESTGIVTSECVAGTGQCKTPCTSDHECGPSGVMTGYYASDFSGQVCGADGFCDDLGCSSDADCENSSTNPGGNTVHLFCVTPPATTTAPVFQSAITN